MERDEIEQERYYESLLEGGTHPQRVVARMALGGILERRGQLADAAEMYERNLWVGAHDQQLYRRLASVYRRLEREDLVEQTVVRMAGLAGPPATRGTPPAPQAVPVSAAGFRDVARGWLERLLDLLEPGGSPVRAAAGWLALACIFAAGAAFVFTLVSPVLGSGRERPATEQPPPPPIAAANPDPGVAAEVGAVQPTATDVALAQAKPDPAQQRAAAAFASGGLGLPREEWERAHGRPERGDLFIEYEGGRFIIGYSDGLVWYIERTWGSREVVTLEAARGASRGLMPADVHLARTVNPSDDQVLDVHASDSLTPRFRPTAWNGGKPGTFTVRYRVRPGSDQVTAMQFRLGDGPPQ